MTHSAHHAGAAGNLFPTVLDYNHGSAPRAVVEHRVFEVYIVVRAGARDWPPASVAEPRDYIFLGLCRLYASQAFRNYALNSAPLQASKPRLLIGSIYG